MNKDPSMMAAIKLRPSRHVYNVFHRIRALLEQDSSIWELKHAVRRDFCQAS